VVENRVSKRKCKGVQIVLKYLFTFLFYLCFLFTYIINMFVGRYTV